MYGNMQESGLTEIIPFICTSVIWAIILCFHSLGSPTAPGRALQGSLQRMAAESGCYMAGILFLPESPQNSSAHVGRLQSLMTVASLFTDMIGNTPFLNVNSITQC